MQLKLLSVEGRADATMVVRDGEIMVVITLSTAERMRGPGSYGLTKQLKKGPILTPDPAGGAKSVALSPLTVIRIRSTALSLTRGLSFFGCQGVVPTPALLPPL